ncbi:MAG: DUF973 family protein [Desulfurococcaceae archaeon]
MFASSSQGDALREAYRLMRTGAFYQVISWLLLGIGLTAIVFAGGLKLAADVASGRLHFFSLMATLVALALVVLIAGLISLVGLLNDLVPGVKKLRYVSPAEFSTAATLTRTGFVWGVILMVVGALTLVILVGYLLVFIAYILLVIGLIGVALVSFKLGEKDREALFTVAGILFILSIIAPIFGFIAWLLFYVALGRGPRFEPGPRQPTTAPPLVPPTPPSPV